MDDTSTADSFGARLRRWLPRLGRETGYLMAGFPLALAAFCLLVTLIAVSLGTVVIWVGVPLLAVTLWLASAFGRLERARLRPVGCDLPDPPRPAAPDLAFKHGLVPSLKRQLSSTESWRSWAHSVVVFPLATFTWSVAVSWWAIILAGLTEWFWRPFIPADACVMSFGGSWDGHRVDLVDLLRLPIPQTVFDFLLGVVFALTVVPVTHGCVRAHQGLARLLLGPTRASVRIAEVADSRAQVVSAQADELRRVERDIHDGPQQLLIRVGMDVAAAQRRLAEGDVDGARDILARARELNDQAVDQLRAVARGIVPPVLADRGLVAALESLCASSAVPCRLDATVPPGRRWGAATENAFYFIAAESLANAVKHAGATEVVVSLRDDDGRLVLEVVDDGRGGAAFRPGHGLEGLRARAAAIDAGFGVDSLDGQGTRVRVEADEDRSG